MGAGLMLYGCCFRQVTISVWAALQLHLFILYSNSTASLQTSSLTLKLFYIYIIMCTVLFRFNKGVILILILCTQWQTTTISLYFVNDVLV